jgi:flagellin
MGFRIQHNIPSINARRHLDANEGMLNRSLEKLSSGFRINSAADDAAGLAASMRFRSEVASLKVASRNAGEASSLLQVAEGAMSQIEYILIRLKELATQAASANAGSDLSKIDAEASQLESEIDRIIGFTEYNGAKLLDGSYGTVTLTSGATPVTEFTATNGIQYIDVSTGTSQTTYTMTAISVTAQTMTLSDGSVTETISFAGAVGLAPNDSFILNFDTLGVSLTANSAFDPTAFTAGTAGFTTSDGSSATFQLGSNSNAYNRIGFYLPDLSRATLAGGALFDVDLTTHDGARTALDDVESAINKLALSRSDVGALMNRIAYTKSNLGVAIENKTASESVIRDVDMASEMAEFTKSNILVKARVSMLSQANQVPQSVLQLHL